MPRRNKSGKEYLFVDGYNIINSWDSLKEKALVDLEEARKSLIETMVEYHHSTGIEVIVVFDAHMVKKNSGTEEEYKGIEVVYTKERETADHYIESKLDDLGKLKRIRVATSDWLEQQIVLSRGGTRISARELELEVERNKDMINRKKDDINTQNSIKLGKVNVNLDPDTIKKLEEFEIK